MTKCLTWIATAALGAFSATAAVAEYPERPITMIVAYSAGGGTDIAARTLAPFLEKYLGNDASITVVNRPGAGGEVGFTALANAEADGYTIGFINTPNLLTIPIQRDTRYTLEDIQPVANIVYDPGAFSVLPDAGIENLDQLVEYARVNPGKVTYGTTGIGSDDHLAALAFERQAGVEFQHVPFDGNADVRAAVLGGHIMMASMNVSETIPDADEGTLVLLGQMAEERWEGAPETPTFQEQGYDIVMGSNRSLGAPAGIPDEALQKLSAAAEATMQDPEFIAAAEEQDLALSFRNADQFSQDLQNLQQRYEELWEEQPWIDE
ncbi:tripartite tricarboxylate transporter substrate binding protein [Roseitranquillus sediminis]|uniref:tripartite tricarboxylate transporter substrate binding protein n=1 Tax=Roseitranquillus sediminis TaxID=2809051 RepID=UPI001D0C1404|nr:tripartite tricarboxylate transporter substrate binding protein [Roseitranquillus sediminis]MBM9595413.1 tripartite tricarboxylate transporter substrate binding protein [Roseitranquillus sediminis]